MRFRTLALAAAVTVTVGLFAGCGADASSRSATGSVSSTGSNVAATFALSEWKITLDGNIPSGTVTVKADNQGGERHEVVIVAAQDAGSLPKKADGSVDEDRIPDADKLGETGDIPARGSTATTFTFKPGTYVAFCNIIDDMGMTGTTMMGGATGSRMMGGNGGGSMMGNNRSSSPMGTTMGHVHFSLGMSTTFTVK
jgi:plastocyanin